MHLTDAELAITAAEAGAAVVRSKYGSALRRLEKSSTDFATEADLAAGPIIPGVIRVERGRDGSAHITIDGQPFPRVFSIYEDTPVSADIAGLCSLARLASPTPSGRQHGARPIPPRRPGPGRD